MPCYSETPIESVDRAYEELNQVTRFLCEACEILKAQGLEDRMSVELSAWWIDHQVWDEKRKAKDKRDRERAARKKELLDQMPQEDREALGFTNYEDDEAQDDMGDEEREEHDE